MGSAALDANTTGANNTAVGQNSLGANTTADDNTAVGKDALLLNTTGAYNTAIGRGSLTFNQTAANNTAVGYLSLNANTTGTGNTAIGTEALDANTTANSNTAVGTSSLTANTTGSANTAMGHAALGAVTTGVDNSALGKGAGAVLTTGNYNVYLGRDTLASATGAEHQIVAGYNLTSLGNNNFTFGKGGNFSNISFGESTIGTGSDERLKEEIADEKVGLSFINELRPVTFKWKKAKDVPNTFVNYYKKDSEERVMNGKSNHGFIAQEIKTVLDKYSDIKDGFSLWQEAPDGTQIVAPAAIISILTKAVQELSTKLEAAEARISALES